MVWVGEIVPRPAAREGVFEEFRLLPCSKRSLMRRIIQILHYSHANNDGLPREHAVKRTLAVVLSVNACSKACD